MSEKITVYHGTDLPLGKRILRDGIKAPSIKKVKDELFKKHNLKKSDIPEEILMMGLVGEREKKPWTKKEKEFFKRHGMKPPDRRPYSTVTTDFYIAADFATRPFELRNLMERNILEYRKKRYGGRYKYTAKQPVVLTCSLKNPKKHMGDQAYNRCKKLKSEGKECGWGGTIFIRKGEEKDLKCTKMTKVKKDPRMQYKK